MLILSFGERNIQIPYEFCLTDGVPDSSNNCSRLMKTFLGFFKQNSLQKMYSIAAIIQSILTIN